MYYAPHKEQFEDENGRVFIPKYKIVCPRADIKEGDLIQCRMKDTNLCTSKARSEGRVVNVTKCNYLDYMVVYV